MEQPLIEDATRPTPMRSRRRSLNTLELRARRRRVIGYAALAISFGFMVNALVGEKGVLARVRSHQEYAGAVGQLTHVRHENAALLDLAQRLKSDPATIEDIARQKLNLIRPGETLFIIKDAKPAGSQ